MTKTRIKKIISTSHNLNPDSTFGINLAKNPMTIKGITLERTTEIKT